MGSKMSDDVFSMIAQGEIEVPLVDSNEYAVAFADINPQAPVHLLVIPKKKFLNVTELAADSTYMQAVMSLAVSAASKAGLTNGYRLVFNTGQDGGQTVPYVHCHVLGGRSLTWPPG
jgi:histidine triad (HIT) family protein